MKSIVKGRNCGNCFKFFIAFAAWPYKIRRIMNAFVTKFTSNKIACLSDFVAIVT